MSRPLPPECTDVLEAFRSSCFSYPQGVAELAAALGMSATMLYNKANPHDVGHPPTLADAVLVIRATGNPLIVQALAHLAGGAFIPLPRTGMIDQGELLALVTQWMREQGQFFNEFDTALSDKRISPKEMRTLTTQAHKVVTACLSLVERLETMSGRRT